MRLHSPRLDSQRSVLESKPMDEKIFNLKVPKINLPQNSSKRRRKPQNKSPRVVYCLLNQDQGNKIPVYAESLPIPSKEIKKKPNSVPRGNPKIEKPSLKNNQIIQNRDDFFDPEVSKSQIPSTIRHQDSSIKSYRLTSKQLDNKPFFDSQSVEGNRMVVHHLQVQPRNESKKSICLIESHETTPLERSPRYESESDVEQSENNNHQESVLSIQVKPQNFDEKVDFYYSKEEIDNDKEMIMLDRKDVEIAQKAMSKLKKLENELTKKTQTIEELETSKLDLGKKVESLVREKNDYADKFENLENQKNNLEKNLEEFKLGVKNLEEKNLSLAEKTKQIENENQRLLERSRRYEEENFSLVEQKKKIEEKANNLLEKSQEFSIIQEENVNLKKKISESIFDGKSILEKTQTELQSLQEENNSLQETLERVERENILLKGELKIKQQNTRVEGTKIEERLNTIELAYKENLNKIELNYKERISELKMSIKVQEKITENLEEKKTELLNEIINLKKNLQLKEGELKTVNSKMVNIQTKEEKTDCKNCENLQKIIEENGNIFESDNGENSRKMVMLKREKVS